MLSKAKSANVGFRSALQLFAPHTNRTTQIMEQIPFINLQKAFCGFQQCVNKY